MLFSAIQQKIESIGTPLQEWDVTIYYGIKTGYNQAFIIDGKKKDELIAQDPKSAEIIKPILRGRDIKRYQATFADLWLIATHNGYRRTAADSPLVEGWPAIAGRGVPMLAQPKKANTQETFQRYKQLPYNPKLKKRAQTLRQAGILSEVLFWNRVKQKQLLDLDFHRQKIIGNYIVDFYCPQLNLVVEIDGNSHTLKDAYDQQREQYLQDLGLRILHLEDRSIKKELNNVMQNLEQYCVQLLKPQEETPRPTTVGHPSRGEWVAPIDIEQYPAVKAHLDQYWKKIAQRYDQGKTPYHLRNCAYYEEFSKEKIVWKRIGSVLRFCYDGIGSLCLDSTCILTGKNMKYLLSQMNSKLFFYQLLENSPKTGTGDVITSVQAIEPRFIPQLPLEKQKPFERLVTRILAAKAENPQADTTLWENQIDLMVYKLYSLNYAEIQAIDPAIEAVLVSLNLTATKYAEMSIEELED